MASFASFDAKQHASSMPLRHNTTTNEDDDIDNVSAMTADPDYMEGVGVGVGGAGGAGAGSGSSFEFESAMVAAGQAKEKLEHALASDNSVA
jgi:hypothetical protein